MLKILAALLLTTGIAMSADAPKDLLHDPAIKELVQTGVGTVCDTADQVKYLLEIMNEKHVNSQNAFFDVLDEANEHFGPTPEGDLPCTWGAWAYLNGPVQYTGVEGGDYRSYDILKILVVGIGNPEDGPSGIVSIDHPVEAATGLPSAKPRGKDL
jgi:hypothetical protein